MADHGAVQDTRRDASMDPIFLGLVIGLAALSFGLIRLCEKL
jgi:hypothetical protein